MNQFSSTSQRRLVYLGHVAVFYIPVLKLTVPELGENEQTPQQLIEEFLLQRYNAFTYELSHRRGVWREEAGNELFQEDNARYEVSFDGDVDLLVEFLARLCQLIKERAIYLRMGYKSWLVLPQE